MKEAFFKTISNSNKAISQSYKRNLTDRNYSAKGFIQIYDNFHIFSEGYNSFRFSAFGKSKDTPLLFCHIYNYLSLSDFKITEKKFTKFISEFGENHYIDYREFFSLSALICGACIYEAGRICRIAEKNSESHREINRIGNIIFLLRETKSWDFENLISTVSKTDKIFSEFEPYFPIMESNTKNKYRETLYAFCKSQKIGEKEGAELLKSYCLESRASASDILFRQDKKSAVLFTALASFFTLCLLFSAFYYSGIFGGFLCLPSLISVAFSITDIMMSSSEKSVPCPALQLENIPLESKTAVVLSVILIDKEENAKIARNVEKFFLQNRDENILFTILADFPTGKSILPTEKEKEILDDLFLHIKNFNLKYGNRFSALARNRKHYKAENTAFGEERKRGAITALVKLIYENGESVNEALRKKGESVAETLRKKGENTFAYREGDIQKLYGCKYLFLLDSDSEIGFSSVKTAVSLALHPLNKPVVEKGRVVKGYGVFQPSIKFELVYKKKTQFESFISGSGGIDNYESASYERFQSVFGSGVFCGKGLVDVELYYKLVIPAMPDGIVLSHDMPEGNILRCRLVSQLTATDKAPTNAISYFSRLHRWIRGDVQNLFFVIRKSLKEKMSDFSVFKILNNILRHSTPVFSFLALVLSLFGVIEDKAVFIFSSLYLTFPFLSVIVFAPFRAYNKSVVLGRRYYSEVTGVYLSNFSRLIYEFSTLPHNAYIGLDATIKSLWRLFVSKKNLLEWKTFEISEKTASKSKVEYFIAFRTNIIFGLFFIVKSVVFTRSGSFFMNLIWLVCGLLWFIAPFFLYLMSKPIKPTDRITDSEKKALFSYSEKIWKFFAENVDARTNFLPPDNIQTTPTDAVAMRTSPTNIGLYLLSCLSANDFGVLDKDSLIQRIEKTISTIEGLEKWNGHLFNWYDLKHLTILGEGFVSTVDSGNFVTSLVALRAGLEEKGICIFSKRINKLIDDTNFLPLYNSKKALFSIGYHTKENRMEKNCYDLFMSEARSTSYFAVARGIVPQKHWQALGRTLISNKKFSGLASWSGTMFEYFMPSLLLPVYNNSFSYEALNFAFYEQRKYSEYGVWGISESGFYAFDSQLNYQYKAHGVPSLSLKRYENNEVIFSPYSSFLTLGINRRASIENLEMFKKIGAWGNYGFYEAVDFTWGKGIVKSYMAHHMGMSIVAAANACFDNIFVRRFMSDKEMDSASQLLKEKIPTNAPVFENPSSKTEPSSKTATFFDGVTSMPTVDSPVTAIINKGNLSIRIADCGTTQLLYRGTPINEAYFEIGKISHTLAVGFIDSNGRIKYITPLLSNSFENASFEYGLDYSSHIISEKDFASSANYFISDTNDCFIIETKGNIKRKLSPFLVFEPQMTNDADYYSAKSFSNMKTRVELCENFIYITSETTPFTACVTCDKKTEKYLLSRDDLNVNELFYSLEKGENTPSVYPLCYLRANEISGGNCKFYIGIGKTREQSKNAVLKEMKMNKHSFGIPSDINPALLGKIASKTLFQKVKKAKGDFISARDELWKRGVSGDFPIYAIYLNNYSKRDLEEYLKIYNYLYSGYLKFDLFIFYDEEDFYFAKTEKELLSDLLTCNCICFKDKSPGIHLFSSKELFRFKDVFCAFDNISNQIFINEKKEITLPLIPRRQEARGGDLYGGDNEECKKTFCEKFQQKKPFIEIEKNGFIFHKNMLSKRKPYSYVLSGNSFGSVVTDSSLGFTFAENSRLCKITAYDESPSNSGGEKLYVYYKKTLYDICCESSIFKCKDGVAEYKGSFSDVDFSIITFVSVSEKRKYIKVEFSKENIQCCLSFRPLLRETTTGGNQIQYKKVKREKEYGVLFYDMLSMTLKNTIGFCCSRGNSESDDIPLTFENEIFVTASGSKALFTLGVFSFDNDFPKTFKAEENSNFHNASSENGNCLSSMENYLINSVLFHLNYENFEKQKLLQENYSRSFIPKLQFNTNFKDLEMLFPFLFYQTSASRFFAKTGYYQNGGAFGFRDQLQDCLSLVYSQPKEVRRHILRCASHQYRDGSVMHWWHELNKMHMGVKTTCSDDYLYLPIVCAKYISLTGDSAILYEEAPFLESPPLENEGERYEKAVFSQNGATLYQHCILAIAHGFENRRDGMTLMGCCDWNDGFSLMGVKGIGVSIFTAWLLIMAVNAFAPYMEDNEEKQSEKSCIDNSEIKHTKKWFLKNAYELNRLIDSKYFINGQYARCISDNGKIFGIGETKACSTDILCQAFAVFAGENKKRAKEALLYAYHRLYNRETETLRLFYPPFSKDTETGGYINFYPANVRENGGQYTHSAVWTAMALIQCGEGEAGLELLSKINPITRCNTVEKAQIYKNEPFVLSADIYSGEFGGRGGWSWYTGAASWFSVAIIEYVLGLHFSGFAKIDGKRRYIGAFKSLKIKPLIPYTAKLQFGDYTLTIIAKKGIPSVKADGLTTTFPCIIPAKDSVIEVFFE